MPIAGMLSDLPPETLAEQFRVLRDRSNEIADWGATLPGLLRLSKAPVWRVMPGHILLI